MKPRPSEIALRITAVLMGLPSGGEAYSAARGCLLKRGYATQAEAEQVRRRLWARERKRMSSYWCRRCGGWHLTGRGG